MTPKLMTLLYAVCLFCFLIETDGAFIKGKNIPRVGRSNEADGAFGQGTMGYVIKTNMNKNIPRMGRRNYDSENRFDIPKFYQLPGENFALYGDDSQAGLSQDQIEAYYGSMENMKR